MKRPALNVVLEPWERRRRRRGKLENKDIDTWPLFSCLEIRMEDGGGWFMAPRERRKKELAFALNWDKEKMEIERDVVMVGKRKVEKKRWQW
ncbi:hypothetical protein RJT34_22879 [Clitoria ternatea]|uniref:Uncharacterized protein n=1 Tax=Clitoria ternatea TaxID=43366 RepID=A0AAN9FR06_CLITE